MLFFRLTILLRLKVCKNHQGSRLFPNNTNTPESITVFFYYTTTRKTLTGFNDIYPENCASSCRVFRCSS